MLSYHNDPEVKRQALLEMRLHRKADALIKGRYWENGKGCAVGCLTHDSVGNHQYLADLLNIPVQLAHLEDAIFENLDNGASQMWPERFLSAIPVGADLAKVWPQFAVETLTDLLELPDVKEEPPVRVAIENVIALHRRVVLGEVVTANEWSAAASPAGSAAWSARSAAGSAAWSAERSAWSAAGSAAGSAAWSAAWTKMADRLVRLIKEAK